MEEMVPMVRLNLGRPVSTRPDCQHGTLHLKIWSDKNVVVFLAFLEYEKMELYFDRSLRAFNVIWNFKFYQ